ncbi:MAG TPA: ABC transporter substrate-binding protein [Terriglobia bacterium]|nr:ABC transporter substrate-binding protein [Terriglobia bacterium]
MKRFAAILLALSFAACGKSIEKAREGDSLVMLRGDKSEILDPHATSSGGDAYLIEQMYERLVRAADHPPVEWEPSLAESWEISPDFRIYTFHLRPDVLFQDGARLDSSAVKRSFDRARNLKDPAAPPRLPYAEEYLSDIVNIETPDAATVVFTLKDSNPKFLANTGLFASSIVSPTAIAEIEKLANPGERQAWLTRHPAGTGPYTIAKPADYQDSMTITMTAFDGYWGGKPAIPRVVFKWTADSRSRREQILAGAVQMIDSPATADWTDLDADPGVTLYKWRAENLCYLAMNMDPARGFPTTDVRLRKAIAMAVDREPLVALYDGAAVAHHVLLPPTMLGFPEGYMPSTDQGDRATRLEKARELLRQAGMHDLHLKLLLPAVPRPYLGKPPQVADLIRQQLADIGITVELEPQPMNELGDSIANGRAPLVLIGWMGETGEPDDFWRPLLSGNGKPSENNAPRFWRADVAGKVDVAMKERRPEARRALYEELEKTVHEEYRPMAPLLSAMQAVAWRSELEGVYVDSTGVYRLAKARYRAP